ncbi:MAG: hypothetical protein ACXWUN_04695 [Allosphingosinicella sp.]
MTARVLLAAIAVAAALGPAVAPDPPARDCELMRLLDEAARRHAQPPPPPRNWQERVVRRKMETIA